MKKFFWILFTLILLVFATPAQGAELNQNNPCEIFLVTAPVALNLRDGPGVNYKVVASTKRGDKVVAHQSTTATDGKVWYLVSYKKYTGWASSKYLESTNQFSPNCDGNPQSAPEQTTLPNLPTPTFEIPTTPNSPYIPYVCIGIIVILIVLNIPSILRHFSMLTDIVSLILLGISVLVTVTAIIGFSNQTSIVLFPNQDPINWWWLTYIVNSITTFLLYAYDKAIAIHNGSREDEDDRDGRKRTPEKHLLFAEILGGWPGGMLARTFLRHKINWRKKFAFKLTNWVIICLHIGLLIWYFLSSQSIFPSSF